MQFNEQNDTAKAINPKKDKIETLIGFMVKASKIVYGKDAIQVYRKKMFLIVLCSTASQRTKEDIKNFITLRQLPLLITKKPLSEIVFKQNCKVIAITNSQAAQAIIQNTNENYELEESNRR